MKATLLSLALVFCCACASIDKKVSGRNTNELKLRHSQLADSLGYDKGEVNLDFMAPMWMRGPSKGERLAEKEAIERVLLARYRNGDKDAHLAIFGDR
jgi:hypothetical protein